MMKIYLTILLCVAIIVPFVGFAAYNDVSVSDTTITVGGINLTVSGTAIFESITISSDSFTIDLPKSASLTVTSSDKRTFTVSPSQYQENFSCTNSESTMVIANNLWDTTVTVTVTPSSTTCSMGGGSVSGGGGGGGGGGGNIPTPVQVTIPGIVIAMSATTPATSVTQPSPVAQVVSPVFNTTLKYGMTSDDIKRLQQLLASDPEVYPEGIITGWFGQLTKKAVEKFQNKYGLDPVGIVGPQTRAKLAEVFGSSSIAQSSAPSSGTTAPSSSVSAVFTIGLKKGMSNGDIKRLQQLLNSDPDTKIADSGIGSPGNETEYFGSLTEIAIKKLQSKYGLASEGDAGYGYVGPKTRAKLQKIFSQ